MEARALQRRFDRKYVLDVALVAPLVRALSLEFVAVPGDAPRLCRYETRYLDTPGLKHFHDHRRGVPRRMKVRVRNYLDRGLSVLEIKRRTGRGTTDKVRVERQGSGALTEEEWSWLARHGPTPDGPDLVTTFSRLTLLSEASPERLTIDLGLGFSEDSLEGSFQRVAIVEVKTLGAGQRSTAVRWLHDRRHRPRSFSKYCVGRVLLRPELPRHGFARALKYAGRLERTVV